MRDRASSVRDFVTVARSMFDWARGAERLNMKGLIGFLLAAGAVGAGVYVMRGGRGMHLAGASRRRGRGLRGPAEIEELTLFINNDGDLHRGQTESILKNLATKMAKGVYDRSKAEKLWMYLVESGAKKYASKFGGTWHQMFSMQDRRDVAKQLNDEFVEEAKHGNYDHLAPKKYRKGA